MSRRKQGMDLRLLAEAVAAGRCADAARLTLAAADAGHPPGEIMEKGLVPGMQIVGERYRRNDAFVPEVLIAARAMKQAMTLLEPLLASAGVGPRCCCVIGTVEGDRHDLGKNIVAMALRGAQVRVVDLGTDVPPRAFVAEAVRNNADVVALSALLTVSMPAMARTVAALRQGRTRAKVIVGGAPVTQQFSDTAGADGYAADAAGAVDLVLRLAAARGPGAAIASSSPLLPPPPCKADGRRACPSR